MRKLIEKTKIEFLWWASEMWDRIKDNAPIVVIAVSWSMFLVIIMLLLRAEVLCR